MSVIVKICGLATEAGLDAALACGADMAGFVFFDKSPRHVSLELAANLGRRAANRTCKVLVTVDAGDHGARSRAPPIAWRRNPRTGRRHSCPFRPSRDEGDRDL